MGDWVCLILNFPLTKQEQEFKAGICKSFLLAIVNNITHFTHLSLKETHCSVGSIHVP